MRMTREQAWLMLAKVPRLGQDHVDGRRAPVDTRDSNILIILLIL